jgi:hypothetical protein
MNWEYASILSDGPARKETLDALGGEGWELVSVLQGAQTMQLLYVLKRPSARIEQAMPIPGDASPAEPSESPNEADPPSLLF